MQFSLPLATKEYILRAAAIRAYREAADAVSGTTRVSTVDVDEVEDDLEALADAGEEALHANALAGECREYLQERTPELESVLYLAELGYETPPDCYSDLSESASEPEVEASGHPSEGVAPEVAASELLPLPAASEVSAAQFEANSVLPQQQGAGDMSSADLPPREQEALSDEELVAFLMDHSLEACDGVAPLAVRAAKLKKAMAENPALVDPSRSSEERRAAYQMLLSVADVFATSLNDLEQPADCAPFEIDTGDALPIKARPFKMGQREVEYLNTTILG